MNTAIWKPAIQGYKLFILTWLLVFPITGLFREEAQGDSIGEMLSGGMLIISIVTLIIALAIYVPLSAASYGLFTRWSLQTTRNPVLRWKWFLCSLIGCTFAGVVACLALGSFSYGLGHEYATKSPSLTKLYASGFNGWWASVISGIVAGIPWKFISSTRQQLPGR